MKAFALLLLAISCVAQQPPPSPAPDATIAFRFERADNAIPNYTLTVRTDGSAIYQVSYPPEIPKYSPYAATLRAQPNTDVTMNIALSPATTARLFASIRATNGFHAGCASRAKNIADTGAKTLTYTSSAGVASCVYNFTEDKTIVALTNTFMAIAYTLDEGRRLDTEHRYDRLALDRETESLVAAAKVGTAVEFGAIAPTLQAIADDPQVLERVRTRAAKLLAQSAANP